MTSLGAHKQATLNTDGREHNTLNAPYTELPMKPRKMLTIATRALVLWLICHISIIMKGSVPLSGLVLTCVLVNIAANRQDEARFLGWLVVSSSSTPDSSPEDPCGTLTSFSFVLFSLTNRIAEAPTVDFRGWLSWYRNELFSDSKLQLWFCQLSDRVIE